MAKPTRRHLLLGAAAVAAAGAGAGYALLRPDPVAVLARRLAGLFPEIAGAPPALRPAAVAAAGRADPPSWRALLGQRSPAAARPATRT
ncbi:MAG: hypothetical protein U1E53_23620 [Dongiaceae bacterium]